jgi:endonuclease YncB( thermonuclease family)
MPVAVPVRTARQGCKVLSRFEQGLNPSRRAAISIADVVLAGLVLAIAALVVARLPRLDDGPVVSGPAEIIDGDSLRLEGREIRLEGIDAPELHQLCERSGHVYECGRAARRVLVDMLAKGALTCRLTGTDRYGRALGRCATGADDLNAALVREGWAVSYGRYQAEESEARSARRGIWQGSFERPSDWRRAHPRQDR